MFETLTAEAQKAIDEDGADVILLGSTTMHQAGDYMAAHLPAPVINPGPVGDQADRDDRPARAQPLEGRLPVAVARSSTTASSRSRARRAAG